MTKLTDIQHLLLASAASRADGSLLPPSDQLADLAARVQRAIASLLRKGLVIEFESPAAEQVWREEDSKPLGAMITETGRAAAGIERAPLPAPERTNKIDSVVAMLGRDEGATLVELTDATGWLPHTTRAALTRLRQKGHVIEKAKRGETTCYRSSAAAA